MSEVEFPEYCQLRCDRVMMSVLRLPELNGLTMKPLPEHIGKNIEILSYPKRWSIYVQMTAAGVDKRGDWILRFSLYIHGRGDRPFVERQFAVREGVSWLDSEVGKFLSVLEVFEACVARHCPETFFLQYSLEDARAAMRVKPLELFWPLWGILRWFAKDEVRTEDSRLYFSDTIDVYYGVSACQYGKRCTDMCVELTFVYHNEVIGESRNHVLIDFSAASWTVFRKWAVETSTYFYSLDNRYASQLEQADFDLFSLTSTEMNQEIGCPES